MMKNPHCKLCDVELKNVYCNKKYCEKCTIKRIKQHKKKWREKNYKPKPRTIKIIDCKICNTKIKRLNMNQKYCVVCVEKIKKERNKRDCKRYREKHKKKVAIKLRNWRINNKDKINENYRRYSKTTNGRRLYRRSNRKRKLKKLQLIESFTPKQWQQKLEATKGFCPCCNQFIGVDNLTLDHTPAISKASKGFEYTINNIQPLCRSCNASKGDKY